MEMVKEDFKMAEEIKKDDRRFFLGPDEFTKYYIVAPNAEVIRGADWVYSKNYTKCLVEGITTSAEMMDILMKRGIIGPEFEQRSTELTEILAEKIAILEEATSIEDKRILAIDVANAREELFQWNQRLNGPMSNTCEQMADDARLEYLTAFMVENEDGTKVWESYDAYLTEKSQALALKARFEIMVYLQGLDSDFLEQTPEAVAMKEIEADLVEKAEEALKVAQALEEERIKAEEEAMKAEEEKKVEVEKEPEEKKESKKTRKKRTYKKKSSKKE